MTSRRSLTVSGVGFVHTSMARQALMLVRYGQLIRSVPNVRHSPTLKKKNFLVASDGTWGRLQALLGDFCSIMFVM